MEKKNGKEENAKNSTDDAGLNEMWKELSDAERRPYIDQCEKDNLTYAREFDAFRASLSRKLRAK